MDHKKDFSHLSALEQCLSREGERLAVAKTENERALRRVWVAQYEKEIAGERAFLGLPPEDDCAQMSLDEILAELGG